ncbi:hypothetical protein BS50DRAFT_514487 [Corynespora cassiicola Philippines]|uniref:Reverse transcriptase domain-containing protein n=1 Tax=Corynespora cassiicola Philippines TaxID=1448308 RepID=A0A2T2P6G5_CORCC|nr:hypothetical protein BS50DRAFT_514487 [Corynespora cassiicola Philippines]
MTSSSGSVFSETLQTITTTKLQELAEQRATFDSQKQSLLATLATENDPLERLFLLAGGVKVCLNVKLSHGKADKNGGLGRVVISDTSRKGLETDLKNLDRFLEQARYDQSVSPKVLQSWEKLLLQYLQVQSSKYQYADLYGKLVTEWLASEKTALPDGDVEMTGSFEEVPGAKKLEARAEWEKSVFEPAVVDVSRIKKYLDGLFFKQQEDQTLKKATLKLQADVEEFEAMLEASQFNVSTLTWIIQGLQNSDLLSNEKRETLNDFLTNEIILGEIADVLNMRMAALTRWSWGDHVPLEQRPKISGGYSINMHEDLLQAIFLHYLGVKWSVFFKQALLTFREAAWSPNQNDIPKIDLRRRRYFLGHSGINRYATLENERASVHTDNYFLHQLLDHDAQQIETEEGEEEVDLDQHRPEKRLKSPGGAQLMSMCSVPAQQPAKKKRVMQNARKGARISAWDQGNSKSKKPMENKQKLLHLLSTEIVVNTRLHGGLTCFHAVFDSWNPLLSHDTILTVLGFFGVSSKWANFFKSFLKAPLKFLDDINAAPRARQRGTPGSHSLSDMFGEVVLFCLDVAVNQVTDGGLLYRIYDDTWFWSPDYDKCATAWESVVEFASVMNARLNNNKTGSVHISSSKSQSIRTGRLPEGDIRWGFLVLDPNTGQFEVDAHMVDAHIDDLGKQLEGKSKSVIDWVQAWNSYATNFFSSNFGKAANCYGRQHVDKILATHSRIQARVFNDGNVVQFLKEMISKRFAVDDIPDGFLFFPVDLGGLELRSPFVGLLQIRESVMENPYSLLDEFEEEEKQDYLDSKTEFDDGDVYNQEANVYKPEDPDTFFSLAEFTRYREEFSPVGSANLVEVYEKLLRRPSEESIDFTHQILNALERLAGQNNLKSINAYHIEMDAYWKWITQMHGPEMVERFGGLNIVDSGLLPIGMVGIFRQKRIKWQD